MTAYYNEHDMHAAEWLRNLIKAGEIAHGEVDTRSIEDVTPNDVRGYTQCHWFAGVGGWSRALRLAGWSDSKFAWTGSCPCQPFSSAGKGAGTSDVRHLWPAWMHLIRQCKPSICFGEQVSAAIRHGWLDLVFDDLENSGYACGAAIIPAGGIGAPHLRERVWFVGRLADDAAIGHARGNGSASSESGRTGQRAETVRRGDVGNMARTDSQQRNRPGLGESTGRAESANGGELGDMQNGIIGQPEESAGRQVQAGGSSVSGVLGNVHSGGRKPRHETGCADVKAAVVATGSNACELASTDSDGCEPGSLAAEATRYGQAADTGSWDDCVWIPCTDGKWRPTQPGIFPLAYGVPAGVGSLIAELERMGCSPKDAKRISRDGAKLLRAASRHRTSQIKGYGNAIVPAVAAEFIRATL